MAVTEEKSRTHVDPLIEAYKQGLDRSLIRRNLRRDVTERFEAAMALQRFAEELRRAGRDARHARNRDGFPSLASGI